MMADSVETVATYQDTFPDSLQNSTSCSPRRQLWLQKRLKFFFMNPCDKFRAKRRFPWKLVMQLVKIVLVTIQLAMFGFSRSSHVDFLEKSGVAFHHLFLEGWDPSFETLPYPPATGTYAIYTIPHFYDKVNYVLEKYNKTDEAIGAYDFDKNNHTGTIKPPVQMCQTFYKKGKLRPSQQTYEYDAHRVTECFELGTVWKCNDTEHCEDVYDAQTYLDEDHENRTIQFDKIIEVTLEFSLKTIHLKALTPMSTPDCYEFNITITFDNTEHNGQMVILLDAQEIPLQCVNGTIDYAAGTEDVFQGLNIFLDVIVILVSIMSLILCVRSIWRAQFLKKETLEFFERHRGKKLNWMDQMEFLNLWYVLIIINDILTVLGSVLKISIETKYSANYESAGVLLGTGNLLVWFGVLRYLGFFKKYNILILTMKKSAPNVMRFLVCAGVFYFGFAVCGWVVLGPYHLKFRHLSTSSETLFSLMNGDDIYDTFSVLNHPGFVWWFLRLYVYIFIALFCYVVLNLCMALILDTYDVVKFRHLSTSSECLFSLVNGDDMFVTFSIIGDDKPTYIWWFSRAYLYIFVSLFIYVVLNLFIAVILDTYEVLKHYHELPHSDLHEFINACPENAFSAVAGGQCNLFCCCFPSRCCWQEEEEPQSPTTIQVPTERTGLLSANS